MRNSLDACLALLNALQRERGLALKSAPVDSMEALSSFEMQSTFTALALEKLEKELSTFGSLIPRRFQEAIKLRNNETFRESQPLETLSEWYAFNLEEPVLQITLSQLTQNPNFSPAQVSALTHYLASITALAHLRDLGLTVYARAELSRDDLTRLRGVASACLARERLFLGLADETTKQILNDVQTATIKSLSEINEILHRIKSGQAKGLYAETPPHIWFEKLDQELSSRFDTLKQMASLLDVAGRELAQLNAPGHALDSDVEHALEAIGNLPLFHGLSESTLRNVLKGAKLMDLPKNTAFLTQDDPNNRFYILMDGWAKVYKTTAEGEEAILQILSRRECLLDNVYLNLSVSTVSARTTAPSRILALSLSALRDTVSRNTELAQNLLAATTNRLHKIVAQFEQITLRTAEQRVGWFLVNLHLETGLEDVPLELPYDKALIAAYLNIKPETFSRVLKKFRKKGFTINKHQVILPHPQALCQYCDPEMALRCCRAETVSCAPIKTARRASGNS